MLMLFYIFLIDIEYLLPIVPIVFLLQIFSKLNMISGWKEGYTGVERNLSLWGRNL